MHTSSVIRVRPSGLLALGALFVAGVAVAGPRLSDRAPDDVPSRDVMAAISRPDPSVLPPHGYGSLVRLLMQNRTDVRSGLLTEAEAAARGGTAIAGSRAFPVFPFLYDNTGSAPFSQDDLEDQLFTGPWPTGTMKEYYEEVSYGLFSVTGHVEDWFTLDHDDDYYEGFNNGLDVDGNVYEAMVDILDDRDPGLDFGLWDNDGPDGVPNSGDDDGYVDFIMFVTPDPSGACGDNDNIWSHTWFLSGWGTHYETDDAAAAAGVANIRIDHYFMSAGIDCTLPRQRGIGTHCHEFGHALGLPDLYDTDGGSEGIGDWGLMGNGNNNTQDRPAHFTAFHKERLGWLHYYDVTQDATHLCVPPVETHPAAVRLWTHGRVGDEYFLVENRQQIGFDDQVHGTGFVIYHVDERVYAANLHDNAVNTDEAHKAVDVECADATTAAHVADADDLDRRANEGDAGDVWCPATEDTFDDTSVPDTRSCSGGSTEVSIQNIDACTGVVCADFNVGSAYVADLCIRDCVSDGCDELSLCEGWWGSPDIWIDNDGDGVSDLPADALENDLWFRIRNVGPEPLSDVTVSLYYGDPAMGQLWPSFGTLIESRSVTSIDVGEVVEDYVPFVYPAPPVYVDHYCIGAVVTHELDPQNSEYPPNDNNVAQVNHQVLVNRAGGSLLAAGCGPFVEKSRILLHAPDDYAHAVVRLGTPPTFADYSIPPDWTVSFDPGPYDIYGTPVPFNLTVESTETTHRQMARIPLTLWDLQQGRAIGGVLMNYVIDCSAPKQVGGRGAEWLSPHGDYLIGPTVLVEWDRVTSDEDGEPEIITHYEVQRSDDHGTPWTTVERVAVDAELEMPWFQWYDDLTKTCDVEYYYRVRGVDAAGSVGAYSATMTLACEPLDVADTPGAVGWQLDAGTPNPFRGPTEIRYGVPVAGPIRLDVFDVHGRRVRSLVNGVREVGEFAVTWDGRDDGGRDVEPGIYFHRLRAGETTLTRKTTRVE